MRVPGHRDGRRARDAGRAAARGARPTSTRSPASTSCRRGAGCAAAMFTRIDPRDRDRLVAFVTDFAPTRSRTSASTSPTSRMAPRRRRPSAPRRARSHALGAAARAGRLERVALRSGLEVYGRGRGRPARARRGRAARADHAVRAHAARGRVDGGRARAPPRRRGVARCATPVVAGSHVAEPARRACCGFPAVPVPAFADPPFSLLAPRRRGAGDGAKRSCAGTTARSTSSGRARRARGRRCASAVASRCPCSGPGWRSPRAVARARRARRSPHVIEVLRHGRTGDGSRAVDELELGFVHPTQEVLRRPLRVGDRHARSPSSRARASGSA